MQKVRGHPLAVGERGPRRQSSVLSRQNKDGTLGVPTII